MGKPVIRILWAEDNIADILLIKEAFKQAGLSHRLSVVNNGVEAMDFLFRRGRFTRSRRPDLIILDLNMPKKGGREVIKDIKTDSTLSEIPLVVLTSSSPDQDVLNDLNPKRCLYLVKPSSFNALVDLAKQIQNFLLSLTSREQGS
ncbi:MAG: response regulator [Sedimentisphaerales bacterium]|jgi:CheY-like chemotaxis protein